MIHPTLIVINDPNPVSEKHICWYSEVRNGKIVLYEVVERMYRHPHAPDHAYIPNVEVHRRSEFKLNSFRAAPLSLLLHANQTMDGMAEIHLEYGKDI